MPLAFMEHFLIQSEDIEVTKGWYVNSRNDGRTVPRFKFPGLLALHGDRGSDNRLLYLG